MSISQYMPRVAKAEYLSEYKLKIRFTDGLEKVVDFAPFLRGGIFEPLKDTDYFKNFYVDEWTVTWKNGADIAPDTLYEL
ncbi:MAG: hypothetical protein HW421_2048 [Ignavibacteria bacterium]|nr:hypothetical protein [Ignavibacteria bacterium]